MEKLCSLYKMFSLGYFIYLAIAVAVVISLVFICKNFRENAKKIGSISLVFCAGVFVLIEYLGRIIPLEEFKFFYNLPVELIHVLTYICIITLVTNSEGWSKFLYLIALPLSAYSLLIIPNFYAGQESFSLITIGYVFALISIMSYSLLNIIWRKDIVKNSDLLNANITYLIFFASVHLINVFLRFSGWATQANYMGTMGEDFDVVLSFVYKFIPFGFICNLPLIAILILIEYLIIMPFVVIEHKRLKQEKINELISLGNAKAQQEASNENNKEVKSQIIVKSEEKAKPNTPKKIKEENSDGKFLNTNKVIQINNEVHEVQSSEETEEK